MLIPLPYRPASAPTAVFGAESFLNRAIFASRRGVPLKKLNFVWILLSFAPLGGPPGHSAPSPILPAGKLYTTQTMLPSGKTLKCRILVGFCGVLRRHPSLAVPGPRGGHTSRKTLQHSNSAPLGEKIKTVPFCPVLRRFFLD